MPHARLRKAPLSPDLILIENRTGSSWKIDVIEAITAAGFRKPAPSRRADEVAYVYGCKNLTEDDERIVYETQIGTEFRIMKSGSSLA